MYFCLFKINSDNVFIGKYFPWLRNVLSLYGNLTFPSLRWRKQEGCCCSALDIFGWNWIADSFQLEFHPGKDTENVLLILVNDLQQKLDEGSKTQLLLDLLVAFDIINPDIFLGYLTEVRIWKSCFIIVPVEYIKKVMLMDFNLQGC